MKKINLIKTLIAAGSIAAIAIPTITLTNTGCSGDQTKTFNFKTPQDIILYLQNNSVSCKTSAEFDTTTGEDIRLFFVDNANIQFLTNSFLYQFGDDLFQYFPSFNAKLTISNSAALFD
jgi:hypothetical protein